VEPIASFTVEPLYAEEGSEQLGRWRLRKFQEEVMRYIDKKRDVILTAPTGSGKTLTLLLGLLTGGRGAVGVYPNNTLLLDQWRGLDKILKEALNAKPVDPGDGQLLKVYELGQPVGAVGRVAVALLSGRYIEARKGEPKRRVVLREVVEEVCNKVGTYIITLATPDTAAMVMAGVYRDFERVGMAVHDAVLAGAMGGDLDRVLSEYGVATARELSDIARIRACLLKHPWFIDEFHLYGYYEAYALAPILKVYRDYLGWEEPVVLSSATPGGALIEVVREVLRPATVEGATRGSGPPEAMIRGETEVRVYSIDVPGRGVSKWLSLGDHLGPVLEAERGAVEKAIARGNAFIVVDRVYQVWELAEEVYRLIGVEPECSVSIMPPRCAKSSRVVVGSESISQGIDRPNVIYGMVTAYNWASLVQRFGRVGRRVERSEVVMVIPALKGKEKNRIEQVKSYNGKRIGYAEFVELAKNVYPSEATLEEPTTGSLEEVHVLRAKAVEYITAISAAKVSGTKQTFEELAESLRKDAWILERFCGPPEVIAHILLFRSSGPRVVVEKPGGAREEADLGTVLRNFSIKEARVEGGELVLRISADKGRYILRLVPGLYTDSGAAYAFANMITTIGFLADIGYHAEIAPADGSGAKHRLERIPPTMRRQAIAVLDIQDELAEFYIYTGRGAAISVGGAGEKYMLGLFI